MTMSNYMNDMTLIASFLDTVRRSYNKQLRSFASHAYLSAETETGRFQSSSRPSYRRPWAT